MIRKNVIVYFFCFKYDILNKKKNLKKQHYIKEVAILKNNINECVQIILTEQIQKQLSETDLALINPTFVMGAPFFPTQVSFTLNLLIYLDFLRDNDVKTIEVGVYDLDGAKIATTEEQKFPVNYSQGDNLNMGIDFRNTIIKQEGKYKSFVRFNNEESMTHYHRFYVRKVGDTNESVN